ncbi:MAG: nicotinamide-nucleotide amidohydrolase family protein [Planctomycetota bacterium]
MKPPRAAIVSIGEELLQGRIRDGNAAHFAAVLLRMGVLVRRFFTVGDEPGALPGLLEELRGSWELVLTTGGLGPTADDRVRAEVAALLGVPLAEIEGAAPPLEALWRRQFPGTPPPAHFLAQALVPRGARPLRNRCGTAWGFACDLGCTRLLCLPGPPGECQAAFEEGGGREEVEELLPAAGRPALGTFHASGVTESQVEGRIRDLMERAGNPRLGIVAGVRRVTVSVMALPEGGRSAGEILEEAARELHDRLGGMLWGRDGETLEAVVVELLARRGERVALAESCTGGRLAARLTSVPGASRVFGHGWVTYADEAKIRELGVSGDLLRKHGAVSREAAAAMAAAARRKAGSDWALSVTGIAGPDGGSLEKPVGLVFLGLAGPEGVRTLRRRQYARSGRILVQEQSVRDGLETLRRALLGLEPLPDRG